METVCSAGELNTYVIELNAFGARLLIPISKQKTNSEMSSPANTPYNGSLHLVSDLWQINYSGSDLFLRNQRRICVSQFKMLIFAKSADCGTDTCDARVFKSIRLDFSESQKWIVSLLWCSMCYMITDRPMLITYRMSIAPVNSRRSASLKMHAWMK